RATNISIEWKNNFNQLGSPTSDTKSFDPQEIDWRYFETDVYYKVNITSTDVTEVEDVVISIRNGIARMTGILESTVNDSQAIADQIPNTMHPDVPLIQQLCPAITTSGAEAGQVTCALNGGTLRTINAAGDRFKLDMSWQLRGKSDFNRNTN